MKKIIALTALLSFSLVGCPETDWAKLASDLETQEKQEIKKCDWKPLANSMFNLKPLNTWFAYVPPPIMYEESHWYLEAYGIQEGKIDYDELRTFVLNQYVKLKMLPPDTEMAPSLASELPFPDMFYSKAVWNEAIRAFVLDKYGSDVQFCKVRVTIRSKRRNATPDLKWWDEITINLDKAFGECQPCEE